MRFTQKTARHEVHDEARDGADVGPHHGTRQCRQSEKACRTDRQGRQTKSEERVQIGPGADRSDFFRIEPRHDRTQCNAERNRSQNETRGKCRTDESTDEVRTFSNRSRTQNGRKTGFIVAQNHVGDHRHDDENKENAQNGLLLQNGVRRIDVHIALTANLNLLGSRRAEREKEKEHPAYPSYGASDLVSPFKGRNVSEHVDTSLHAAAEDRRCSCKVEKYTSSSPASTGTNPSPGGAFAIS